MDSEDLKDLAEEIVELVDEIDKHLDKIEYLIKKGKRVCEKQDSKKKIKVSKNENNVLYY